MSPSTPTSPANRTDAGIHPSPYRLPDAARVGLVRLAVSNLERSVAFYTGVIGLSVLSADPQGIARLGVKGTREVLLELQEVPGVQSIERRTRLGLYHTAFLLPTREALASFVLHLESRRVPFGSSDHLYSEALYLTDPDGLTVEVYADRPSVQWTVEERELVTGVLPLRLQELTSLAKDTWSGVPPGTTMGHLHFFVGDLEQAKNFYHHALGLDIMTWRYPGALFTSAGGYHHHVGLNIWAVGSPPASDKDARLLFWKLVLPGNEDVERVKASFQRAGYSVAVASSGEPMISDPWGIRVVLATEGAA